MINDAQTLHQVAVRATREERIDFLKQSVALAEHNIRSYDTKAQLTLAATLLSMPPLWTIISSLCAGFSRRAEAVVLVFSFLAVILLYCNVLRPVRSLATGLLANLSAQSLFYIKDPTALNGIEYARMVERVSIEDELTLESLKLARLRSGKHARFYIALGSTFLFYALYAVMYLRLLLTC